MDICTHAFLVVPCKMPAKRKADASAETSKAKVAKKAAAPLKSGGRCAFITVLHGFLGLVHEGVHSYEQPLVTFLCR